MRAVARSRSEMAGDAWGMRCDCWSQWRSRSSKQIIAGHNVEQLLHSSVLSSLLASSICATRAWSSEMDGWQFSDVFNFSPTLCSASSRLALQTSMGQISDSSSPITCAHSLRNDNAANPVTPRGTPKPFTRALAPQIERSKSCNTKRHLESQLHARTHSAETPQQIL